MNHRSAFLAAMLIVLSSLSVRDADAQAPQRQDTPTGDLLDQLDELNRDQNLRYSDRWAGTMRDMIRLGPDAVPELIDELDATTDETMLRCLAFSLRAIGDKRAVPALIRSIPRTLIPSGFDIRSNVEGADLARFMQENDLDPQDRDKQYRIRSPVREVFGALQALTGQRFDEEELAFVRRGPLASQIRAQERLYYQCAKEWSDWWEAHWDDHVDDKAYAQVNLPPVGPVPDAPPIADDLPLRTAKTRGNSVLEPLRTVGARMVFKDLDTGRLKSLPDRWDASALDDEKRAEIVTWATGEGFDLMGDEFIDSAGNRTCAIRPLGLKTWELGKDRWKARFARITLGELKDEGRSTDKWLLHVDPTTGNVDSQAIATFLFLTREGTPGLLFIGVEVQDITQTREPIPRGADLELKPTHVVKGRRYATTSLVPLN